MKPSVVLSVVGGVLILAFLDYMAKRSEDDLKDNLPPKEVLPDFSTAYVKATTYVSAHGGRIIEVLGTGSMAPYIPASKPGQDPLKTVVAYAVIDPQATFDDVKQGDLDIYFVPGEKTTICHVAAQQDSGGWIMSGLHNKLSESWRRMTKETFVAKVAKVFTWEN